MSDLRYPPYVSLQDSKIQIQITKDRDDDHPIFEVTEEGNKQLTKFMLKNMEQGIPPRFMFASSCHFPEENGLPEDTDINAFFNQATEQMQRDIAAGPKGHFALCKVRNLRTIDQPGNRGWAFEVQIRGDEPWIPMCSRGPPSLIDSED